MRNTWRLLLSRFRGLSLPPRGLLLGLAAVLCFMVLAQWRRPVGKPGAAPAVEFPPAVEEPNSQPVAGYFLDLENLKDLPTGRRQAATEPRDDLREGTRGMTPDGPPLIAHSAQLAVASKEFAKSRSSLEEILQRHRGYAAKLRMAGRRSGSVLSATLRIPSPELGATVNELKSLGDVEQEEQSADEVTQQRADLEARLSNAQSTLRRLQELLKKQTYPDGNVRELQGQIANAGAEVNRLEAERLASEHRVIFANVQFALREELSQPEESLGSQLHAAAVAGFSQAAASISALLLFLIGRGPVCLLWMVILFLPARLIWRRLQVPAVQKAAPAAGV